MIFISLSRRYGRKRVRRAKRACKRVHNEPRRQRAFAESRARGRERDVTAQLHRRAHGT